MADFEDSNSPYWRNMVGGQVNLADAINGSIEHSENGKDYRSATTLRCPRPPARPAPAGGHLQLDAGRGRVHGLRPLRAPERRGASSAAGARTSTPKLESQREAAWRDAFLIAEETLGLDRGTIKATVLIETIPAAFCMDAILYELRDHAAG